MKSRAGREIAIVIRMMGPMESPEPWNAMKEVVLSVGSQVEREQCQDERQPGRNRELVEKTPPALATKARPADTDERKQRSDDDRADDRDSEIADPPQSQRAAHLAARDGILQQ